MPRRASADLGGTYLSCGKSHALECPARPEAARATAALA